MSAAAMCVCGHSRREHWQEAANVRSYCVAQGCPCMDFHLAPERVTVACESVSVEGNRCARQTGHEGCHEVGVDGDMRRWWDWKADTPGELPSRQLVIVRAAEEGITGEPYPPAVGVMTAYAVTDAEMLAVVRKQHAARSSQPTAVYLAKHDGTLRRIDQ